MCCVDERSHKMAPCAPCTRLRSSVPAWPGSTVPDAAARALLRHYEKVSPADKGRDDIVGDGLTTVAARAGDAARSTRARSSPARWDPACLGRRNTWPAAAERLEDPRGDSDAAA